MVSMVKYNASTQPIRGFSCPNRKTNVDAMINANTTTTTG
jgi:hypothetical protein